MLYNPNVASMLLGCLLNNPSLSLRPDVPLTKADFAPQEFHKILFVCISHLAKAGVTDITELEIDNFIDKYEAQKEVLQDSNYYEFLTTVKELANLDNFDFYYNTIRKFSLLRELKSKGHDISKYYDETEEEEKAQRQLEQWTIKDILNDIDHEASLFRNKYDINFVRNEMVAGEDTEELISEFEEAPAFGSFLTSPYLTQLYMGLCRGHLIMNSSPAGTGKALPDSLVIPTLNGNKKVKDICLGDYLFDKNGKPTRVVGIFPQGIKQIWNVKFKDGRIAKCCKDHLWTVRPESLRHENKTITLTTEQMVDKVHKTNSKQGYYYHVPLTQPVNYSTKHYKISPYCFGLFLGDGSFRSHPINHSFGYSSKDQELIDYICQETGWRYKKNTNRNYLWSFYNNDKLVHVEDILEEYPDLINAYSENKYIPQKYLEGDIQQRFDLLNGLLDSDGSCVNGRISFYSTSPQLIRDVKTLCYSLGLMCRESIDKRSKRYKSQFGSSLHIVVPEYNQNKIFRLQRKKDIYQNYLNSHTIHCHNIFMPIIDIEPTDIYENMTCFLVDNDEHLFLTNDYIVTHNTRMMIADLCNISVDTLWNEEAHDFITNLNYDGSGLFIHSELASRKEINPMFLACVSGVNVKHITMGQLEKDEKARVLKAGEILQKNNMVLCDMPDFTSANIKRKIEDCVKNFGTTTVGFDYLQLQSAISAEYKASTSIPAREDLVLRALATDLKAYAEQYNVAIMTASQLNGSEKQMEFPDESCLSSSKAIKQKLDGACITLSAKDRLKEYKKIEPYLKRKGFGDNEENKPNIITYVYKSRFGEYADQKIKIWRRFNRATLRNTDFFCTDQYDNLISIPKPVLEGEF